MFGFAEYVCMHGQVEEDNAVFMDVAPKAISGSDCIGIGYGNLWAGLC